MCCGRTAVKSVNRLLKTQLVQVLFWFAVGSVESPYLVSTVPYLAVTTPYLENGERSAKRNCWPSISSEQQTTTNCTVGSGKCTTFRWWDFKFTLCYSWDRTELYCRALKVFGCVVGYSCQRNHHLRGWLLKKFVPPFRCLSDSTAFYRTITGRVQGLLSSLLFVRVYHG